MLNFKILACTQKDIEILVETIRKSFQDVAQRFGLTEENAPLHPSNCIDNWIKADIARGVTYFVMENENKIAGVLPANWQVQIYAILKGLPCFLITDNVVLAKHWLIMFYQRPGNLEPVA